jgi:hypothetical protein
MTACNETWRRTQRARLWITRFAGQIAPALAVAVLAAAGTAAAQPDTYRVDIYGTVEWVNGNWASCSEGFDAIVAIVEDDPAWEGMSNQVEFYRCRGNDNGPGVEPRIRLTTVRQPDGSVFVSGDFEVLAPECPVQSLNTCRLAHFEKMLQAGDRVPLKLTSSFGNQDSVKFETTLSYLKQNF